MMCLLKMGPQHAKSRSRSSPTVFFFPCIELQINELSNYTTLPIAAYNVSGEYAMLKAAAANGWLDEKTAMVEMLMSIRRSGANIILTYFAKDYAQLIKDGYVYN